MQPWETERTGWRDEQISKKHHEWGFDFPATDIDWLVIEYDYGKAKALVEYKNEHAKSWLNTNPNYLAERDLADRAGLPFFGCRYTDDLSWYTVAPLNDIARQFLSATITLSEKQYVALLWKVRKTGL